LRISAARFLQRATTGALEGGKWRGAILSLVNEDAPMNMPGIEFLRDRKGRRKAVLIDLKKHKQLWEDLYDAYLAHSRRGERRESLATVKRLVEARAKRKARG
jgi:hypothetical protein